MKPTLSLCLVISKKDFAAKDTLTKLHTIFDEIIIVSLLPDMDVNFLTYKYGAKLFNLFNSNNLVQAKNYAISKATSDWLLMLDQNEKLEFTTSPDILDAILTSTNDAFYLLTYKFSTLKELRPKFSLRLFRRKLRLYLEEVPGKNNGEIFYSGMAKTVTDIYIPSTPTSSHGKKQPSKLVLNELIACLNKTTSTKALGPYLVRLLVEVLLEEESYAEALLAIEKGLAIYDNFNDLIYFKGICHFHLGQFSLAINTFYDLIGQKAAPLYYYSYQGISEHLALLWLGLVYETVCEHKQAVISYTKALKACPQSEEAVEPLIRNLLKINSFTETVAYLDRHFDFNSSLGIRNLAKAFFNLGHYTIAHQYLQELTERSSLDEALLSIQISCLIAQGMYEEANSVLKDIITVSKDFKLRILRDRCIICWLTNQIDQAKKLIDVIKMEDLNINLHSVLSDLHHLILKNNLTSIKKEIKNLIPYKDELFNLFYLLAISPNERLLAVAEELLIIKTGYAFLLDLAKLYVDKNLLQRAEKTIQVLLSCGYFSADAYHLLGQVYFKQHNFIAAIQYFNQALAISPSNHASYLFLSDALNFRALEVIEKGLANYPDSELLQLKKESLKKLTKPR